MGLLKSFFCLGFQTSHVDTDRLTHLHVGTQVQVMPFAWQHLVLKWQAQFPILHKLLAGYFSQAIMWEMMALLSAKPTQSPPCCFFPATST